MNLFVGTSGYSYKAWKGSFYPEKFPDKKMLNFYSEHFNTVEINNTFYRMPKQEVFESWKNQVNPGFKFVIKAPKQITHIQKLETGDNVNYFVNTSHSLADQLGALLFQLPPYYKKDLDKLQSFVDFIPSNTRAAFEFRNESWFDEEVYNCLKKKNFSICLSDTDENPISDLIPTADWIYLRFRKTEYTPEQLKDWNKKITSYNFKDAFIFFKHEDEGKGPMFAKQFLSSK